MIHVSIFIIINNFADTSAEFQTSAQTQTEKEQTIIAYLIHRGQQPAIAPRLYTC